jgi:sec-independent protein translocase protein TatA
MFGDLGVPEVLFILGIALLIFGPRKLGDLGKGLGEGIRGFKSALRDQPTPAPKKEETKEITA